MKRREFITLLGGAAAAGPLAARAQQAGKLPTIGYLGAESPTLFADGLRGFHQGLSETGYIEAKNVAIEYRWAEGHYDRLPALAFDLVRRQVAVIATPASTTAAQAAKAATTTIPIVFQIATDPVAIGLVSSLARPGGNLTGITSLNVEVGSKLLELLHEVVPAATVVALLVNPTNRILTESISKDVEAAARILQPKLRMLPASTEREIDDSFATAAERGISALAIAPDVFFYSRSEQLAALAVRYALPAISPYHPFAVAGGLMSYGTNIRNLSRLVGIYTGRVLNGENPGDLPVQQTMKVELTVNLKAAKALGISIPLPLSGRADEVIE